MWRNVGEETCRGGRLIKKKMGMITKCMFRNAGIYTYTNSHSDTLCQRPKNQPSMEGLYMKLDGITDKDIQKTGLIKAM